MNKAAKKKKRKAEFIQPPNNLKTEVGSGGLSEEILDKAQILLEKNNVDFAPMAEMYLSNLSHGIELAKLGGKDRTKEQITAAMLYPIMQLKANGAMFQYPLVTEMSDLMVQFLESIKKPDLKVIEVILAYQATVKAVIAGSIKGKGGQHGKALVKALNDACERYFQKHPKNFKG